MISLIIPPKDQISRVAKMLADEFGTASNIKSRVNRLSVLGAITSVQQRLKLYNKVPPNGLVVYCGTIVTEEGKEKKVNIDFEPFKPINTSLYLCDNKFHTEALTALLSDDSKFGFIVMDGSGALFGTLQGNTREVLHKFTVDLPKKHGQQFFSPPPTPPPTRTITCKVSEQTVLFGNESDGGEVKVQSSLQRSALCYLPDALLMFIQQLFCLITGKYFEEISQDTGKYCFGVVDTLKALEMGAVEMLIVWENLEISRIVLHCMDEAMKVLYLTPEQEKDRSHFMDKESGVEHEVMENMPLLEWFANNYKKFEGSQFVRGFGGIGGILRYRVDFQGMEFQGDDDEFNLDDY
uniref:Eukaryotic peptide chain release factor subunit 1 n=1 Tax=Eptatretus burgeri TaxID=7764 RepID=A0A8C4QUH6_EPTBU